MRSLRSRRTRRISVTARRNSGESTGEPIGPVDSNHSREKRPVPFWRETLRSRGQGNTSGFAVFPTWGLAQSTELADLHPLVRWNTYTDQQALRAQVQFLHSNLHLVQWGLRRHSSNLPARPSRRAQRRRGLKCPPTSAQLVVQEPCSFVVCISRRQNLTRDLK